jgi:hypothetical protein
VYQTSYLGLAARVVAGLIVLANAILLAQLAAKDLPAVAAGAGSAKERTAETPSSTRLRNSLDRLGNTPIGAPIFSTGADGELQFQSAELPIAGSVMFEQDVPCEALFMQVPNLIWSELVSYGADSFEAIGCNERQPFRDWGIGHALTVRLSAPRLHRFMGGKNRRATVLLECA